LKALSECIKCPLGKYCNLSPTLTPVDCPIGTYQDLTIPSIPDGGVTGIVCGDCPVGYYCNALALVNPIPCTAGTYSSVIKSTTCTNCPAGSYCLAISSAPIACGAGFICPAGTPEAPYHPTYSCPAG